MAKTKTPVRKTSKQSRRSRPIIAQSLDREAKDIGKISKRLVKSKEMREVSDSLIDGIKACGFRAVGHSEAAHTGCNVTTTTFKKVMEDAQIDKMSMAMDIVLRVLNEAAIADRSAIEDLLDQRVPCNMTLANHPTIQVSPDTPITVGVLGMLNGIVERLTGQRVAACYDDAGRLLGFKKWENAAEPAQSS